MKNDCVFCGIAEGEVPSFKVYEDEQVLAYLDINPFAKGHTLVIPKEHYKGLLDTDDKALAAENALVMDELNPEVRMYLDETKKVLKAHFLALGEEKSAFELEWEEKVEAFSKEERKMLLAILKKSLKAK